MSYFYLPSLIRDSTAQNGFTFQGGEVGDSLEDGGW